jgi:putative transposase
MLLRERKKTRLNNHDYSGEDSYFITVCTTGRQCLLGYLEGEIFYPSEIGKVASQALTRIGEAYENVVMDSFVVMPNHVHCIIVFRQQDEEQRIPLDRIMRNFKSFTTNRYFLDSHRLTPNLWQRGYYEHVIRHDEVNQIRRYIDTNLLEWVNDRFYTLENEYLKSIKHV